MAVRVSTVTEPERVTLLYPETTRTLPPVAVVDSLVPA